MTRPALCFPPILDEGDFPHVLFNRTGSESPEHNDLSALVKRIGLGKVFRW